MEKTNQQIADKVFSRIGALILHELPKPFCQQKQREHMIRVEQIKKSIAFRLYPADLGLHITAMASGDYICQTN